MIINSKVITRKDFAKNNLTVILTFEIRSRLQPTYFLDMMNNHAKFHHSLISDNKVVDQRRFDQKRIVKKGLAVTKATISSWYGKHLTMSDKILD